MYDLDEYSIEKKILKKRQWPNHNFFGRKGQNVFPRGENFKKNCQEMTDFLQFLSIPHPPPPPTPGVATEQKKIKNNNNNTLFLLFYLFLP